MASCGVSEHPRVVRDHSKLIAFQAADALALAIYQAVRAFPAHERFGLAQQLRRAVVSAAANIVEGCARATASDFAHFLTIAYGSAREAQYELDLAVRLGYIDAENVTALRDSAERTTQLLNRLLARVRTFQAADAKRA